MKFKHFFASMLATAFLFFFTATAFATDPGKTSGGKSPTKTDPGKANLKVPSGYLTELSDYTLKNSAKLSKTTPTESSARFTFPTYYLEKNEFGTVVSLTFNGFNPATAFMTTQSKDGQQSFIVNFNDQNQNDAIGQGKATPAWLVMEVNRINRLPENEKQQYLQPPIQTTTLHLEDPGQTTPAVSSQPSQQTQPAKTSRSGTNKTQR